jgi:putative ABC transport system permease protein
MLAVLALGIGINGAVFNAIKTTFLEAPPFLEPDRLALLEIAVQFEERPGAPRGVWWSWPQVQALENGASLPVDAFAAYATRTLTLTDHGDPARLTAEAITPGYFEVLGILPAQGRSVAGAGTGEADRQVVLSHALWRARLGADPDVLGSTVTLNGEPMIIVGIAPPAFRGLSGEAEVWVPVGAMRVLGSAELLQDPQIHWLQPIARMRAGATIPELQSRMEAFGAVVQEEFPWRDPGVRLSGRARSLSEARLNPDAQRAVMILGLASALVLLVACANLAALLLARGAERRREIAVRLALGASRLSIARLLVVETLMLTLGGCALGLAVAAGGVEAIASAWPEKFMSGTGGMRFVDAASFGLDAGTVAFSFTLALLTGVLFGVGPAIRLSRGDLGSVMRDGAGSTRAATRAASRRGGVGRLGLSGRTMLLALETGVAFLLLVGAGLMVSTLANLLAVDRGFEPDRLLTFDYNVSAASTAAQDPTGFHDEFLDRIRRLPGVVGATAGCAVPLSGHCIFSPVSLAGETTFAEWEEPRIGTHFVERDYFSTLQVSVVQGRTFSNSDRLGSPPVVIINESAAREYFGDLSPVGHPLAVGIPLTSDGRTAEIIGVVADVLYDPPDYGTISEAYFLDRQQPEVWRSVIVRTTGEPFSVLPGIRAALATLDSDLPIYGITTIRDVEAGLVGDRRLVMSLLIGFGAMALLLAATGIWGVVAYDVVRRHREIGIRLSLGAESGQVVRLVLRQGFLGTGIGLVAGTVTALFAARLLASQLYEVAATDPRIFVATAGVVFAITLLAGLIPARRASRVDPMVALRAE